MVNSMDIKDTGKHHGDERMNMDKQHGYITFFIQVHCIVKGCTYCTRQPGTKMVKEHDNDETFITGIELICVHRRSSYLCDIFIHDCSLWELVPRT